MKALVLILAVEVAAAIGAISDLLQGAAASIILLGGVCAALPLIWRFLFKPVRQLYRQTMKVHDVLLGDGEHPGLTERLDTLAERDRMTLARLEQRERITDIRLDLIEKHIGVVADAERHNVRAAVAQYQRREPDAA